jgi:hypothetical protein
LFIEIINDKISQNVFNYEFSKEGEVSETDLLYLQLTSLVNDGRINEAENLLFEQIDTENKRYLELAIDFYSKLNDMSDKDLEKAGFTREEIDEGLKDVADNFGFSIK